MMPNRETIMAKRPTSPSSPTDPVPAEAAALIAAAARSAVEAQEKYLELKAEFATVRETVKQEMAETLEQAWARNRELQAELAAAAERVAAAEEAAARERERAEYFESMANEVRSSTSWRITAPLRGMSGLLRR